MLYDVNSTYFEGQAAGNALTQYGYSRDKRSDCKQVCIALVVSRSGMPVGYEVFVLFYYVCILCVCFLYFWFGFGVFGFAFGGFPRISTVKWAAGDKCGGASTCKELGALCVGFRV